MLEAFPSSPHQVIGEDGHLRPGAAVTQTPDELHGIWETMMRVREFDRKLVTLLRQGRTTFYAQASGMEATQIGIARGLRPGHDWLWGYYRDHGIALGLGMTLSDLVAQMLGSNSDLNRGRQMPHHPGSVAQRFVSGSSSIASQVPAAVGTAMAQRYLGVDEVTVCTFGDGATSEGDWHAGLNMAAVNDAPCLFICENNQWAISTPAGRQTRSENIHVKAKAYGIPGYYVDGNDVLAVQQAVAELAGQMRAGGGPALLECLTYRVGSHSNADADAEKTYRSRDEVREWTARDPIARFERFLAARGQAVGSQERSDLVSRIHREIEAAVQQAEASGQPDWRIMLEDVYSDTPVHLRHQYEGLRQEYAGRPEGLVTATQEVQAAAGEGAAPSTQTLTLIQAVTEALRGEMRRDERVLVFGEDVGARGGVFLATAGLQAEFGERRVFDTPLSEAAIVGAAVGMAVRGLRPVAEIQFADYIGPGFDQLTSQAAKLRYRSGGQFTCPLVIRTPSGGGVKGGHHHSQSPEAYYCHTPGLKVVMPSTPYDALGLLRAAIRGDDPVMFFEPKRLYRAAKGEVPTDDYVVELGRAAIRRAGDDISLIGYGGVMPDLQKAAEALEVEGVSAEVIDLRSLVPWDRDMVLASVARTGRAVLVSEAPRIGNFMGEVASTLQEEVFDSLLAPVVQVAGFDTPYPYVQDRVYLPGAGRILNAAVKVLNY